MNSEGVNPRYEIYASTFDRTPDEQLAHDKEEWPGGCMCGFILWIQENVQMFCESHEWPDCGLGHILNHDKFTDWLRKENSK